MSDFDNMDLMIGNDSINPIETELANILERSAIHYETEPESLSRRNSSQENELRDFGLENTIPRKDRFLESMERFTNEIN